MQASSLNAVYSRRAMRRRYEVWFVRLGLANGRGAWWFRYLLLNLGRGGGGGCQDNPRGMPVQLWAIWFPREGKPQAFIQGFSQDQLSLSERGRSPFYFQVGNNRVDEASCAGSLEADGHQIRWQLRYRSTVGFTLSDVGWIGFSRTAHSDAVFSGKIQLDGQTFRGEPLGYGLQGHNCGFRHRHLWTWTHCLWLDPAGHATTFEALEYELPLGLRFRKALLWHGGELYLFRHWQQICRERENLQWIFRCMQGRGGARLVAVIDGSGSSLHRLAYLRTDCASSFEVANNSLARARLYLWLPGRALEEMGTDGGAVIEMVGE